MGTQNYSKKHRNEVKNKQNISCIFQVFNQALIKEKGSKISCRNIKIEGQNVMIGYLSPSMLLFSLGLL